MTASPPPLSARASLRPVLLVAAVTVVCLAPFLTKAFHVDDYLFLRSAQQIRAHPADPFGVMVNWYGFPMPLADVTKNPPGAAYFIAAASTLVGWSEFGLHLAFLLPAVAAVIGTYFLARRMCDRPLGAALATLLTPAFLVSGTTVMCDTLLLACWVWATLLWIRGVEQRDWLALTGAAVLMAAAALTKYFGACLIPLLLSYAVVRECRAGWWIAFAAVPVLALLVYDWATAARYGHGMFLDAGSYAMAARDRGSLLLRVLTTAAFAGGSAATVLFLAPLLCSWLGRILGLVGVAGLFALLHGVDALGVLPLRIDGTFQWLPAAQFAVLAGGGGALVALVVWDFWRCRDAVAVLLGLWVTGTLLFTGFLNWTINVRSILPLLPAAAILAMRQLQRRRGPAAPERWASLWPLLPAGGLALAVAWADARLADSARTAAVEICTRHENTPGKVWFQGHWGFQYYMEAHGAVPLNSSQPDVRVGDWLVNPNNNTNVGTIHPGYFRSVGRVEQTAGRWLSTMHSEVGAGFYADVFGPMPFAFGAVPAEGYEILQFAPAQWR